MDEVMETMGLRLQQLKEADRDRVGWRSVVKIVTRGRLRPDGTRGQGETCAKRQFTLKHTKKTEKITLSWGVFPLVGGYKNITAHIPPNTFKILTLKPLLEALSPAVYETAPQLLSVLSYRSRRCCSQDN